jgi:hypothetical protein
MSMNIALRLNGQYIDFKWQTATTETYDICYERKPEKDARGQRLLDYTRPSSQQRRWEKLRQYCYARGYFWGGVPKSKARAHFKHRDAWEKRSWREDRKALWAYLCWIRDTPGMEIVIT